MAEYVYPLDQTIASGNNVLLQDSIPCNKGYVIHRNGSGILTLRGIVNNPCAKFARYFVEFNGNIAVPAGETPGEISLALAIDGEALQTSLPHAVESLRRGHLMTVQTVDVQLGRPVGNLLDDVPVPYLIKQRIHSSLFLNLLIQSIYASTDAVTMSVSAPKP